LVQPALLDQPVEPLLQRGQGGVGGLLLPGPQDDLVAGLGGHEGYAGPHDPGADDPHPLDLHGPGRLPTGSLLAPMTKELLPDVRTERLDLRRFHLEDLDELATVFAQRAVWQCPHGGGMTRDETRGFLERQIAHREEHGFALWAARTLDDRALIGFVGLSVPGFLPEILPAVEVGWRLAPAAWGQGLAHGGAAAGPRPRLHPPG